jgi:hypothetical protein
MHYDLNYSHQFYMRTLLFILSLWTVNISAQIKDKQIKGTWQLAGIDDQLDTDTVRLFYQDRQLIQTLASVSMSFTTLPAVIGGNTSYNAFHNQFMMFRKGVFYSGFAMDSTFREQWAMHQGDYTLKDSALSVSLVFTRQPDGRFYLADFGSTYYVTFIDQMMVLKTAGYEMSYYFRRISKRAVF